MVVVTTRMAMHGRLLVRGPKPAWTRERGWAEVLAYAAEGFLLWGMLAFVLDRLAVPIGPIILGLVLGPMVERNFLTSMVIADGRFVGFFERPIAAALGAVAIAIWLLVLSRPWWGRRGRAFGQR